MDRLGLWVAAFVVMYLCRVSGFVLPSNWLSAIRGDALRFVPIAVFSALAVVPLARQPDALGVKVAALVLAGVVMWRTRQFALGIVVGLGVMWLWAIGG